MTDAAKFDVPALEQLLDIVVEGGRLFAPERQMLIRLRARLSELVRDGATPHTCPVCNGAKHVSRPPHIAGDVTSWYSAGTETYPCGVCNATGLVWRSPALAAPEKTP